MGLVTRQIGPNAKGSKLSISDMDNNLYYLQSLGVSGVTYSANTLTITNPTGGTKSVTISADTDTFITGSSYNNTTNTIELTDNDNNSFNIYIDEFSGMTVNGTLSATTISGGAFYGDGSGLSGVTSTFPYKVYTAFLTQTGATAPTAIVLENTLGVTVTFEYVIPGLYVLNAPGALTIGKTWVTFNYVNSNAQTVSYNGKNLNAFTIQTRTIAGASSDNVLNRTEIEIRVYN